MDRPQPVSAELASDLRNLRQLNRYFGSHSLVAHFLRRWILPGAKLRILDLATGSGDIPRLVVDHARKVGASVTVDAIDQQRSTLEIARGLSTRYPGDPVHRRRCSLLFQEGAPYDIVLCSLALHHFGEADAVRLLARCRELSRKFVLVSDLRRGLLATVGVYLVTASNFSRPDDAHRWQTLRRARLLFCRIPVARGTRRLEKFRPSQIRLRAPGTLA